MNGLTAAAAGAVALLCGTAPAMADGAPFYGYSGYYGRPTTYYTRDPDIQQVTVERGGDFGFGIRTYTTGGPFYRYKAAHTGVMVRRRYHRHVLRVRG